MTFEIDIKQPPDSICGLVENTALPKELIRPIVPCGQVTLNTLFTAFIPSNGPANIGEHMHIKKSNFKPIINVDQHKHFIIPVRHSEIHIIIHDISDIMN